MQVTYFQRRRRPNANFSLEFIFQSLRHHLNDKIQSRTCIAPVYSNGVFRRIWIGVHAMFHQGEINHVTGDINFVALFLSRVRTIVTILDCGFVHRTSGIRRVLIQKIWLSLPVSAAKIVTTISEHAKSEIVALSGCDPQKIVVVPVAISEIFKPCEKRTFPAVPRLLHIGTAGNKNLSRLIDALRGLQCTLSIVGPLSQSILSQLKENEISYDNHVNLSPEDVVQQYVLADVVVFASTYEGFGMPILEAQAVGRPVVTSNTSSMPEVAGNAACLVDPFDVTSIRAGIKKIINDEDYRCELVNRGYENVKRFDAKRIAEQYLSLYQTLADHNSRKVVQQKV